MSDKILSWIAAGLLALYVGFLTGAMVYKAKHPENQLPNIAPYMYIVDKTDKYDISCSGNSTCDVYLSEDIDSPSSYRSLARFIEESPANRTINLHMQGNGGYMDTVYLLYNAIKSSQAVVDTVVEGNVQSAHAFISMLGKHIYIKPAGFFMFHLPAMAVKSGENISYVLPEEACKMYRGSMDRGQDLYLKCLNVAKNDAISFNKIFNETVAPFLTKEELNQMNNGYDIIIQGSEMQKRLEKPL